MGKKRGMTRARCVVPTQREVLRDVMLAAGKYGAWMTLRELGRLTRYGETSISAQLRHLRKPEYGGFAVEKRPRTVGTAWRGEDFGTVWEYQLKRVIRRKLGGVRAPRTGVQRALQPVAG